MGQMINNNMKKCEWDDKIQIHDSVDNIHVAQIKGSEDNNVPVGSILGEVLISWRTISTTRLLPWNW